MLTDVKLISKTAYLNLVLVEAFCCWRFMFGFLFLFCWLVSCGVFMVHIFWVHFKE